MEVRQREGVTDHLHPESCAGRCEAAGEALEETNEGQRPWEYQSLRSDHYLAGESDVVTTVVTTKDEDDTIRAQQETVFWQTISNSTDPADFRAYLEQFPNGVFAALARNRVAALGDPPVVTLPGDREGFRDCPTCPELVVVPAGAFLMGSDRRDGESTDDERPRERRVTVARFAFGVHEVTRAEYGAFVSATTGRTFPTATARRATGAPPSMKGKGAGAGGRRRPGGLLAIRRRGTIRWCV